MPNSIKQFAKASNNDQRLLNYCPLGEISPNLIALLVMILFTR